MKKFIASIAVSALLFSLAFSSLVFASDNVSSSDSGSGNVTDSFSLELDLITQELISQDFVLLLREYVSSGFVPDCTVDDLCVSKYGCAFQIPNSNEDEDFDFDTEIWYCPILCGDRILMLNRFFFVDGELQFNISYGYTDILNNAQNQNLRYFFDEHGQLQSCSRGDALYDALPEINPFRINSEIDYTLGDIIENISRSVVSNSINVFLYPYPTRQQPNHKTCWAASIASMVAYEKPSTYGSLTASNVCDYVGSYDWGNWSVMMTALNHYFTSPYIPTQLNSCLTVSQMQTAIGNDDPVLVVGTPTSSSGGGHAVAMMGYYKNGSQRAIEYMNPNTASIEVGSWSSSSPFYFTSSNTTYQWTSTCRLLYSS